MFTEEDKVYIIDQLEEAVSGQGSPRAAIVGPLADTTIPRDLIPHADFVRQYVVNAVQLCIADGWNNDPLWMERLLDIFSLRTLKPKVNEIWERSKHKPPPVIDPYSLTVINNGTPFVNRRGLRSHLQRLAAPISNTQPILVVSGGDKSGKSYSTNYINHFSNHNTSVIACSATLSDEIGLDLTAEKLAKDLVFQMGHSLNDIPGSETNMISYAESLASWVLNRGSQLNGMNCWLVLDNFKGAQLHQSTRYFMVALSNKITKGMYTRKCRLILLGIDRGSLTVDPGTVEDETISHCSREDIVVAIAEIMQRAIRPLTAASIEPLVFINLPAGPEKMGVLNGRLRSLFYGITRLNEILVARPDINYETVLLAILSDMPDGDGRHAELNERLNDFNDSLSN